MLLYMQTVSMFVCLHLSVTLWCKLLCHFICCDISFAHAKCYHVEIFSVLVTFLTLTMDEEIINLA